LVDYDEAKMLGAVLTAWPINGESATLLTSYFYEELRTSKDAANSLKCASKRCKEMLPHLALWAPFALVGDWQTGSLIY
jgi:CHAT domain-containing protein